MLQNLLSIKIYNNLLQVNLTTMSGTNFLTQKDGLDHQYPAFFSAECPKMRGKGSALIRSILTFYQNPLRHILTI